MKNSNSRPNILLIYPDQHRGDWMPYSKEIYKAMGLDPLLIKMPNMEKLMAEGVTFTRCVSSSPLCAPARACLASGKRYDQCQVVGNNEDYPITQRTFYSVLKESGYNVGGVGKFDLHKATQWWGLDGWIDDLGTMGYTHAIDNAGKVDAVVSGKEAPKDPYMKYLYKEGLAARHIKDMTGRKHKTEATGLPDEAYCDNWIGNNAVDMIGGFEDDQPWFMQINFTGPHTPWDVTDSMRKSWSDVAFPLPNQWDDSLDNINEIRQNYAAMLENIDGNIGKILKAIRDRGELENTIIIYSSDHGESLGDNGKFEKSKPERGSIHIPLVISGPGIKKGIYSEALVETQDLANTIVGYADAIMPEAVDSMSLMGLLEGTSCDFRDYQVSALNDWKAIMTDRYKYIEKIGEKDRLYNIQLDPWENNDIAKEQPGIVELLKNN